MTANRAAAVSQSRMVIFPSQSERLKVLRRLSASTRAFANGPQLWLVGALFPIRTSGRQRVRRVTRRTVCKQPAKNSVRPSARRVPGKRRTRLCRDIANGFERALLERGLFHDPAFSVIREQVSTGSPPSLGLELREPSILAARSKTKGRADARQICALARQYLRIAPP